MNKIIRRTLRSAILAHGNSLAYNPRLCRAYLADLLPHYPEERKWLVAAVMQGIPNQLVLTRTRQQRKQVAIHFGQASFIPAAQAAQVADTWFYAMRDEVDAHSRLGGHKWIGGYVGGIMTGIVVLVLSSAIAFYKAPEPPMHPWGDRQVMAYAVDASLKPDAAVRLEPAVDPLPAMQLEPKPGSAVLTLRSTVEPLVIAQPFVLEDNDLLSQRDVPVLTDLRLEKVVAPSQQPEAEQQPPVAEVQIPAAKPPVVASAVASKSAAVASEQTSDKQRPSRMVNQQSVNQRLPATQPEGQDKHKAQAEVREQVPVAKASPDQLALAPVALQDLQAFVEKASLLRKKQADQQAVVELLKLTGDGFYRKQQAELQRQVDSLQKSLGLLSDTYSKRIKVLCNMAPSGWKDGITAAVGQRRAGNAQRLLQQHWQGCAGLSVQQIRQTLMSSYGVTQQQ